MNIYENCIITFTKDFKTEISTNDGENIPVYFAKGSTIKVSGCYEQNNGKYYVSLTREVSFSDLICEHFFEVERI